MKYETVKTYSAETHRRYALANGPSRFVKVSEIPEDLLSRYKAYKKELKKLLKNCKLKAFGFQKEFRLENFQILCPGEDFYDKKYLLATHGPRQYFFRKLREDGFILMEGLPGTFDWYSYTDATFRKFKKEIVQNEEFLKRCPDWDTTVRLPK